METIAKPASLDDVRRHSTLPVWSADKLSAADVLGISRSQAYGLARTGGIPTLRLGKGRVVVPVPQLLTLLGDRPSVSA